MIRKFWNYITGKNKDLRRPQVAENRKAELTIEFNEMENANNKARIVLIVPVNEIDKKINQFKEAGKYQNLTFKSKIIS